MSLSPATSGSASDTRLANDALRLMSTATLVVLYLTIAGLDLSGLLRHLSTFATDLRFSLTQREPTGRVVLLDIAQKSIETIQSLRSGDPTAVPNHLSTDTPASSGGRKRAGRGRRLLHQPGSPSRPRVNRINLLMKLPESRHLHRESERDPANAGSIGCCLLKSNHGPGMTKSKVTHDSRRND